MPRSPQVENRWVMTWSSPAATRVAPLHLAATAAVKPPHLQFEINPRIATHPARLAIVPAHLDTTATPANRFLSAFGSPKPPFTVSSGRKQGKQYAFPQPPRSFPGLCHAKIMAISNRARNAKNLGNAQVSGVIQANTDHEDP
jgi:hypothetical protein